MEDQQNPKTEQSPRRRRAVRSVPMGIQNESVPNTAETGETTELTETEAIAPMTAAESDDMPLPSETEPEQEQILVFPAMSEQEALVVNETVEQVKADPVEQETASASADAERTFAPQQKTTAKSSPLPIGAVLVTVAVIAVLCVLAILPFLGTTEAVMLYVDDTAIGYLAHENDASAQMERVREDLRLEEILDADTTLYRCENEQIRGDVTYLSSEDVYDALYAQATDGYVYACCILRDTNEWIGVLTEAELFAAADAAKAIFTERYTPNLPTDAELGVGTNSNFRMFCFQWIPEDALMDTAEMAAAMVALQDTPYQMFNIVVYAAETVAERIPYETTLVPNDENFDGIRTMISPGADGLAQVSYRIWYDPETGEELSREETTRVVVREPVSAVSYEGLYPLPDGVSTGTFDWPLPPLPDDELPLDENGNPYMPENPLALKNTYVSSGYGERDLWGTYDFHLGLDIVAPAYTEIYAADGGVVQFAAFTSSYGYMTRILHEDNVETVYAHQIKLVVKPGDVVEKGQLIGYVGSTGNSSGSHLHLEFRRDHVTVDPLEYIVIPEEITVLGEGY